MFNALHYAVPVFQQLTKFWISECLNKHNHQSVCLSIHVVNVLQLHNTSLLTGNSYLQVFYSQNTTVL